MTAFLPISDIPNRPSCHLPQLAFAVTDRAPQRPVVEMLGSHAGRPVAHGAPDGGVSPLRGGLRPEDKGRDLAHAVRDAYDGCRPTKERTTRMIEGLATHSDGSPTNWATEFASLVQHATIRGEKVLAYITGVSGARPIVEAKATAWHLELTDNEGTNWLFAHPGAVVLRWMRTQGDD